MRSPSRQASSEAGQGPPPDKAASGARPKKRSFNIAGHKTSISLEAAFWDELHAVAAAENRSLRAIIEDVDASRGSSGLSSAVRVWLLKRTKAGHGGGS